MTSRTFIAVDPGAAGAIAWSNRNGVFVLPMPEDRRGCIEAIRSIINQDAEIGAPGGIVAYHERITGFIPDGGASQMFEFGRAVERVACIMETFDIKVVEITPQAWIKELNMGSKGLEKATREMSQIEKAALKKRNAEKKRDWKNKLKFEAEKRFPGLKVTLKTCDALLILDAAIEIERQKLL